jgi:hypothetical protein
MDGLLIFRRYIAMQANSILDEKGIAFVHAVTKITAISELLKKYDPEEMTYIWETCNGISRILKESVEECYSYKETVESCMKTLNPDSSPGSFVEV